MDKIQTTDRKINQSRLLALAMLALIFSMSLGYARYRCKSASQSQLKPLEMAGDWIRAPGTPARSGYFRKTLHLPGNVKNAWIIISPCDAFEISVNRNPLGRLYLWRPTRPFHNGISEKGQRLTSTLPSLALNFPREYQWDGHDSYRVPHFIDLTTSFQPGKNVVCIDIESRRAPAKICFHGAIELWSGEVIPLASDATWRAEPVPPGLQMFDWTETRYRDLLWRQAELAKPPPGQLWRTLDPAIFSTAFQGQWLRHPLANGQSSIWFEKTWDIDGEPDESWLRMAANRHFDLFVNDTRVGVKSPSSPDLDSGQWVLGRQRALDPTATPELLDPDEVGSIYSGKRFESPRHADPVLDQFTPIENIRNRTREKPHATNRADMPGTYDPKRSLAETRRIPNTPEGFPEPVTPKALSRNRIVGGYLAYNISRLVVPGKNKISIRLCEPVSATSANWSAQLAVDGSTSVTGGKRIPIDSALGWKCWIHNSLKQTSKQAAVAIGPALNRNRNFPRMEYRGIAHSPSSVRMAWPGYMLETEGIVALLLGGLLIFTQSAASSKRNATNAAIQILFGVLLAPTLVLITAILLESCYFERHELLIFMRDKTWWVIYGIAAAFSLLAGIVELLGRINLRRLRGEGHHIGAILRDLPKSRFWKFAIFWILLLCGFLRAYELDFQPLDDDEYASTQAVLAIVETGIPHFVPEKVWYTRSPLFHYFTAAVAWAFGPDIWTLRLQTVAWGVLTALLTYLCGARLFKSSWVAMGALILISIHPFQIYTGHVIRFYQMQQFFTLLTIYFFCKGFVNEQSQRYRYLTVLVFLAAVLSQEISAVIGVPLLIGYLMFAQDLGWKANFKLAIVAVCAMAVIVLDFVVFQTRCLTRVEGVSPNLESAVKLHFWEPLNFVSMYIGYSRLHLMLSFFLLVGLPLAWRERNRNVIAFHFMLLIGILMTNLLITGVSLRYQYWLFPIWILLSVDSIRSVIIWVCEWAYDPRSHKNRHLWAVGVSATIVFVGVILSWSPWRIVGSYDIKILGDSTGAMRYISSQLREGDKIAATEPHTHCGFIEAGQIDYDISIPLLYDYSLNDNGRFIDRNGGAEVVSNLDQFMKVCHTHDRVWVMLNRERFRTRGKNMRWEYPGARFEMFLRKNCELKYRTYLWYVFLWDANNGFYVPFRQHSS